MLLPLLTLLAKLLLHLRLLHTLEANLTAIELLVVELLSLALEVVEVTVQLRPATPLISQLSMDRVAV